MASNKAASELISCAKYETGPDDWLQEITRLKEMMVRKVMIFIVLVFQRKRYEKEGNSARETVQYA